MPHNYLKSSSAQTRSENKTVNIAVVGLGLMGFTHLKAYQQIESARIVAVVGNTRLPVNGILAGVNGNVGGGDCLHLGSEVDVCRHVEDILYDPNIDLIDICTPTPLHANQSIAALDAGKHVLCEKPMARTSEMAREIVLAAKAAGKFFMPAMCMRFWPGWAVLKEIVGQETFGKVLAARFRRVSAPPTWGNKIYFNGKESGGALFDLHVHDADFVQFLFGRPVRVFSSGRTQFSGAIDHVVTQYEVACGATVHAEASWLQHQGFAMSYTVNFERATFDFDSTRGSEALRIDEKGCNTRFMKFAESDGYLGQAKHIIDSILTDCAPSRVSPQDGVSAVSICEAEEASCLARKQIDLAPTLNL